MYTIEHTKDHQTNQIKLQNLKSNSFALLSLNEGACLKELQIKNATIIENLSPLKYSDTYASALLFPFANRIKDGSYSFNTNTYQLDINQPHENNAIHGLVYNKTFEVLRQNTSNTEASVTLQYVETHKTKGFPFTYSIQLCYTLTEDTLTFYVEIKNTDSSAFPFTLGWHPYFISKNLNTSHLIFNSTKKLVLDDRMITTGFEDYANTKPFNLKGKTLDDCFILNSNVVQFSTPNYTVEMSTTSTTSFLQIYTPPRPNTIAIEPTTGVSDSFNNKIGLQVLEPRDTYSLEWKLKLI